MFLLLQCRRHVLLRVDFFLWFCFECFCSFSERAGSFLTPTFRFGQFRSVVFPSISPDRQLPRRCVRCAGRLGLGAAGLQRLSLALPGPRRRLAEQPGDRAVHAQGCAGAVCCLELDEREETEKTIERCRSRKKRVCVCASVF